MNAHFQNAKLLKRQQVQPVPLGKHLISFNAFITFISREYGLLNNNDGSPIQGVRYTADSNINPSLIYEALLKFLSL